MPYSILKANHAGTWKRPKTVNVKDGGTWKLCKKVWVNNNGVWTQTWAPNKIDPEATASGIVLSNNDRTMSITSAPGIETVSVSKTFNGFNHGKWYFEMTWTRTAGTDANENLLVGLTSESFNQQTGSLLEYCMFYGKDGYLWRNGVQIAQLNAVRPTPGQSLTCAFDADARTIAIYKNGVIQGSAQSIGFNGPVFPTIGIVKTISNTMTATLKTTMTYPNARPATDYQALTF